MSKVANQRSVRALTVNTNQAWKPLGSAMFSGPAWAVIARSLKLSRRELEIVRGAFDDQTEVTMATALGISPHTVHTQFERLRHKLGVANRSQLLIRVMREFIRLTASPDQDLPSICARRSAGRCPLEST